MGPGFTYFRATFFATLVAAAGVGEDVSAAEGDLRAQSLTLFGALEPVDTQEAEIGRRAWGARCSGTRAAQRRAALSTSTAISTVSTVGRTP